MDHSCCGPASPDIFSHKDGFRNPTLLLVREGVPMVAKRGSEGPKPFYICFGEVVGLPDPIFGILVFLRKHGTEGRRP